MTTAEDYNRQADRAAELEREIEDLRAAELEAENKELREEVRTLTAGNDSLRKTRAMACRLQTLEHDAWRAFAAYMANRCKWTRKQVMRAMDALAAYDKETKRV